MKVAVAGLGVLASVLAACGGGGPDALTVDGAWARPTPEGATNGVVYFAVTSPVDDAIVGIDVAPDVAASAMVHATTDAGGGGGHEHHGGGGSGEVAMTEQDRLDLPAGDTVALAPGGLHVMLMDLPDRLVDGEHFDLTLQLEQAGTVTVDVVVSENPPG